MNCVLGAPGHTAVDVRGVAELLQAAANRQQAGIGIGLAGKQRRNQEAFEPTNLVAENHPETKLQTYMQPERTLGPVPVRTRLRGVPTSQ